MMLKDMTNKVLIKMDFNKYGCNKDNLDVNLKIMF